MAELGVPLPRVESPAICWHLLSIRPMPVLYRQTDTRPARRCDSSMQGLSHACSLHLLRSLAHRPRGSPSGVGRAGLFVEAGRCRPVICRVHCGRYGISKRKSPRCVLVGLGLGRAAWLADFGRGLAQHQTHALQGPPRNTAGNPHEVCRHGATRNDRPMVSLKVLLAQRSIF